MVKGDDDMNIDAPVTPPARREATDPSPEPLVSSVDLPWTVNSRDSFHSALQGLLTRALASRARVLTLVDEDFDGWRLDAPALLETLQQFVRLPQRQVRLVAARFDRIARQAPRFAAWRCDWAHRVHPLWPAEAPSPWPCMVLADRDELLRLEDREGWRGVVLQGDPGVALAAQRLEALAQSCEPAWPVNTLGL